MPRLGFGVFRNQGAKCTTSCYDALNAGYRHIDSAVCYGNEAAVGAAIRSYIASDTNLGNIVRENIFVTTKVLSGIRDYGEVLKTVDDSLIEFGFRSSGPGFEDQTGYIDLYLIHDPLSKETRLKSYEALLAAQNQGKIRAVGVSNYNIHHLKEIEAAGFPPPAVNQIELHPFCQQRPVTEYCMEHGIVIQAYTPLAQGKEGKVDNAELSRIAMKYDTSVYQILIRWSLQKGYVPLPKSATNTHIIANAKVYDFSISDEDMLAIDALDARIGLDGKSLGSITWNPINAP